MTRRTVVLVAAALLGLAAATIPFYLTGRSARTYVERDLPATLAALRAGMVLEQVVVDQGIYRSSYVLHALVRHGQAATRRMIIRADARHGFSSVSITAAPDEADWRALTARPGATLEAPPPRLRVTSGIFLGEGMRHRTDGTLDQSGARLVDDRTGGRAGTGASRIAFSIRPGRLDLQLEVASVAFDGPGGSMTLSGISADLEGAFEPGVTAASGPWRVKLRITEGDVRAAGLILSAVGVTLDTTFSPEPGGFRPRGRLTADSIVSRGVPFVRLEGLDAIVTGEVRLPAGGQPVSARFTQRLDTDTNFGPVSQHADIRTGVPKAPGKTVWTTSSGEFAVTTPRGLAELLFSRRPELRDAWRESGRLEESEGEVRLDLRWSEGSLTEGPED